MNEIELSICIVNWNTKNIIDKCIQSIHEKTHNIDYEIIIVDNNSTDGSKKHILKFYQACKLILNNDNLGFAKANNQAIKLAKGKYIVFLNPDTILLSNAFKGMNDFLNLNQDYGAIGCRLLNNDGSTQYTCARTFPTLFNQFCYIFFLNKILKYSPTLSSEDLDYWDHSTPKDVDVISGACLMSRRDLVTKLGGFDENIFMYSEDVDFCYRIKKMGYKIRYLPTEKILHYSGYSSVKNYNYAKQACMLRNAHFYFINKHYGKTKATIYRYIILFGSLFRIILYVILKTFCYNDNKNNLWIFYSKSLGSLIFSLRHFGR